VSSIHEVLKHALLEAGEEQLVSVASRGHGALLGASPKITPGIIP